MSKEYEAEKLSTERVKTEKRVATKIGNKKIPSYAQVVVRGVNVSELMDRGLFTVNSRQVLL